MYQVHSVSVMTSRMAEHLTHNGHIHHVTSCLAKHSQAIKKWLPEYVHCVVHFVEIQIFQEYIYENTKNIFNVKSNL